MYRKSGSTAVASLINACCLRCCREHSALICFAFVYPLWPRIKVKVIDTCISIHGIHGYCWPIYCKLKSSHFETPLWPWLKVELIGMAKITLTFSRAIATANVMDTAWIFISVIKHLFRGALPFQDWWWWLQQFPRNRLRGTLTQTDRHESGRNFKKK